MEKFSSIDQVVGKIPATEKKEILDEQKEAFNNQFFEKLRKKERGKTREELMIIEIANRETNKLRKKYGLEDFDIPADNIHIIFEKDWQREDVVALYNSLAQAVVIKERSEKTVFLKNMLHELIHFKSYNALQVTTGENPKLAEYRCGFTVTTRDGENRYFSNLNEAVTDELTKRIALKLFNNPLFTDEIKQTKEVMEKYKNAVMDSGEPLFNEDIYHAKLNEENHTIVRDKFTYARERKILSILTDKILAKNSKNFKNKEEVFEIFAKGMVTGNILPVGRMIDGTFGAGTLRKIAELDKDIDAQENFVKSL